MTKVIGIRMPYGRGLRKKLGNPQAAVSGGYYGEAMFGDGGYGSTNPNPDAWFYGIYQMRRCQEGYIPVQMKFYKPYNPQTEAQDAQRMKLRQAVLAWQLLTDEQKQVYNENAVKYRITGYNLFCKEYMLSH
jgi:hypothetical protein